MGKEGKGGKKGGKGERLFFIIKQQKKSNKKSHRQKSSISEFLKDKLFLQYEGQSFPQSFPNNCLCPQHTYFNFQLSKADR